MTQDTYTSYKNSDILKLNLTILATKLCILLKKKNIKQTDQTLRFDWRNCIDYFRFNYSIRSILENGLVDTGSISVGWINFACSGNTLSQNGF